MFLFGKNNKLQSIPDNLLARKCAVTKWMLLVVVVAASIVSYLVFEYTEDMKMTALMPIMLIPAFNLPITLRLIMLEDEKKRRKEKYHTIFDVERHFHRDRHYLN
ncbi:MAG: hypothetical protein Kapaf2KO_01810 [Candidatus Kapaibacteriales bacterium]